MAASAWVVAPPEEGAQELAAVLGLHVLTATLLRRRGVRTADDAARFLRPRLEDLTDPCALDGMDRAIGRVALALAAGQRIAIHGDYDVDGISATAILLRGLRALGADPRWHLPHRLHDGYGLGRSAVEALAGAGAELLITVDCGINAVETVARARALGLDVVILDHHTPPEVRPDAVIVAAGPEGAAPLCAAGLAFAFMRAVRRRLAVQPAVQPGLVSLAALGTVADVVPLRDDNRRLAAAGLEEMRVAPLAGIQALADVAGIVGAITPRHIGWHLGPRLNAPGRLGDPGPALRLLISDDPVECRTLAGQLDAINRERQEILERALAEAIVQADDDPSAAALVVAGDGWHPGVVGLVAGRLAERYRRPTIAVGLAGDSGRGSARSVAGFNLIEALSACGEHLVAFGGHRLAAGLAISRESVEQFRRAFQDLAASTSHLREEELRLRVDAEVALGELTPVLVRELEHLGPFGAENPEPILAVRGVRAVNRRLIGDGQHIRMQVTDGSATVEAVGFELAAPAELLMFTEAPVDLAVVPETDRLDPERIRLRVEALDVPGMDPETILADTGALLDRLFRHAADYLGDPRYDGAEDAPGLYTKLVGVTFDDRQDAVAALRAGDRLRLLREPSNAHDPHAIRVATHDGQMLGYLRAQLAGRLSPSIDAGARYRATVTAVTGGGDRSLGVNILLERDDDVGTGAPGSEVRADLRVPRPGAGRASPPLPDHLNGGRSWSPPVAEALAAIADGKSVALGLPPGRDRAAALAGAAALGARSGRCALIVAPRRAEVLHRADQLTVRLVPLGMRVAAVHGMQGLRERQRVEAALRVGSVDVVVASAEAIAEGWAAPHADRIGVMLLDGAPAQDVLPKGAAHSGQVVVVARPDEAAAARQTWPDAQVIVDGSVRTGIRLRDRRGVADVHPPLEEVLSRDEKAIVYTAGREHCVQLALWLRERRGAEMSRVAYVHGGLPARVRQIIVRAFCESRLGILVATPALDEEALPADVGQVVMASLPPDRERYAAALGNLGFDRHSVTVSLLFGPGEVAARRRTLNERAPDRDLLAAIYRVLRRGYGERPVAWPDDGTWAELSSALPGLARTAVDAALAIFEEAGLAAREVVDGRSEVQLLSTPRRDLEASWRYREGRRERDAFEDAARWAVHAGGIELLRVAAGDGGGP